MPGSASDTRRREGLAARAGSIVADSSHDKGVHSLALVVEFLERAKPVGLTLLPPGSIFPSGLAQT